MEIQAIAELLENSYNIQGTQTKLSAYQDLNYLIKTSSGDKYILKITIDPNDLDFIRSQNRVLTALSEKPVGKLLPCPIPAINGELICEIIMDGHLSFARLFQFIEGEFLAESNTGLSCYSDLGQAFGQIDSEMDGLEDAVLKCHSHEWDLARVMEVGEDINLIADPADRRLVQYFLMRYREEVLPVCHKFPKGLIHGDGNDHNILVNRKGNGHHREEKVVGVIDFGDMVWGARVHEVAIVLAYSMMGRSDFREVYQEVINGYQEVIRLSELELSLIYYLVAARWCQTMVMAARQEKKNPGSAYHQVSVKGAQSMLHLWVKQNPMAMIKKTPKDKISTTLLEDRYQYFSKAVSLSYHQPIHMVGAAMQYMYSGDGKTYLDCVNNIPHVGHCHPAVVEAGQRQMGRLNTNTRYLYNSLDQYAEKLLSKFPPSLNKVFFVNSGSAATDLAVRLAESFTGCCEYLVLDYAYHGNTKAAIGLSPYKFNRKGGKGKPENVTILPTDGQMVETDHDLSVKETDHDLSLRCTFFAESIVGCAGQIVLSKEFMQQTVNRVRSGGGIYVADEVQTGFGRCGHAFWAYELYDVIPDMVILGKPMGNGHPMGAVVCTDAIARSFETGMEFFSSFGGNPVSCEIGLAVLKVIEAEGLQENAKVVGDYLIGEMKGLFVEQEAVISRQSAVGSRRDAYLRPAGNGQSGRRDAYLRPAGNEQSAAGGFYLSEVRGSGLFLGIEFTECGTGKPATEAAVSIVNTMKERGFLLSTDGPSNNVIKFKPPMCFSMENAEDLLENLKAVGNCRDA